MKAGYVILGVVGVGAIIGAAYMYYRPKASITFDSKNQQGSMALGNRSQGFSTAPGAMGRPLKSWNGYSLSISVINGTPHYTFTRGATTLSQSDLAANTPSNSYVTVNAS